jgi:hypothetical protein
MNQKLKTAIATATGTLCLWSNSPALTPSQALTAVKLGLVHVGFVAVNFDYSDEYLWNWQLARGRSKKYPVSEVNGDRDVLNFLGKQRVEIVEKVQDKVRSGSYREGKSYRVSATSRGMPRPASFTDFHFAIGGCTIITSATVRIGKADSRGRVTCTIDGWESLLSDIYKFDHSDSFNLLGVTVFKNGELQKFEQGGAAKAFDITTNAFYSRSLLGSFIARK